MKGSHVAGLILGIAGLFCITSQVFRESPSWVVFGLGLLFVVFGALVADEGKRP